MVKGNVYNYFNDFAKQNRILVNQMIKPSGAEKIMASADDISMWYEAVQYYEAGSVDEALKTFERTKQNAKMLLNIGCCHLRRSDLQSAEQSYTKSITKDKHFALGHYYLGLTQYFLQNFQEALENLEKALALLRGNKFVDYRQLGYKYQLYSCEILTDIAAVHLKLENLNKSKDYLEQALEQKSEKKHERIAIALEDIENGNQIKLFVPPKSEIFRPSKAQITNLKKKDFIAKAKVISTEDEEDCFACFSGIKDKVLEKKKAEDEIKKNNEKEKYRIIKTAHINGSDHTIGKQRSVSMVYPPKPSTPPPSARSYSASALIGLPEQNSSISALKDMETNKKRSQSLGLRPTKPLPVLEKPTLTIEKTEETTPVGEKPILNECPVERNSIDALDCANCEAVGESAEEMEIEFRFIQKVKLPKGFSLADLQKASVKQALPQQLEFRLSDKLGRQLKLTDEQLSSLQNGSQLSQYSIQCYPANW